MARAFHLLGATIHVAILLCWAGIIPAWRLAPGPVQPALAADLSQLLGPALAMCAGVVTVALLQVADVGGWLEGLAKLVLQVAGILFACLALRTVAPLSFAGYGPGWAVVDVCLHVGAAVAVYILPWVAVIAGVAGLLNLVRRELQPA
jgi:hypothetical protein